MINYLTDRDRVSTSPFGAATVERSWISTLLQHTLADRGEPAYRAGQAWEWAARGATGYEAMTNLPAALRDELASAVRL